MATSPVFAVTPALWYSPVTAAAMATARDGSSATGLVLIGTGGTNGTRLTHVLANNVAATGGTAVVNAAVILRLYLYNGTDRRLQVEKTASNILPTTTTVIGQQVIFYFNPVLVLPNALWTLYGGTTLRANASEDWQFLAYGADL